MNRAVVAAYGWQNLDLDLGLHETKQGVRFTVSEAARREVLDRLLSLNHQRHAEEKAQELLLGKPLKITGKSGRKKSDNEPSAATLPFDKE